MPLVEAPRALVSLEDPEPEPFGSLALHDVEERSPGSTILPVRMDVEVPQQIVRERDEADKAALDLCDPDLVPRNHLGRDPRTDLVIGVKLREVCQASKRGNEDIRDRVGLARTNGSDEHAA